MIRFSALPASTDPWTDTLAVAKHLEATGWDGVWVPDHFMPNEDAAGPRNEAWTMLAALAAVVPGHGRPRRSWRARRRPRSTAPAVPGELRLVEPVREPPARRACTHRPRGHQHPAATVVDLHLPGDLQAGGR